MPVPDWQRGINVRAGDSVAAYAIKETRNNTLTIRVRLTRTDPRLNGVEVRFGISDAGVDAWEEVLASVIAKAQ